MSNSFEPIDLSDFSSLSLLYERFDVWASVNPVVKNENKTAYYLNSIGKQVYSLLTDLMYPFELSTCTSFNMHKVLVDHLKPQVNDLAEISKFIRR